MPRRQLSIDTPLDCTIRAAGTLDPSWSDRLGGLCVRARTCGGPVCELSGRLLEQAALLGVLVTVYDLGLALISVACREAPGLIGAATPPQRGLPRRGAGRTDGARGGRR
jgi:hypothetical protein